MARERRRTRTTPRLDQPRESSRPLLSRPQVDPEVFGRISERFARFMGTARFLAYLTGFVLVWLAWFPCSSTEIRTVKTGAPASSVTRIDHSASLQESVPSRRSSLALFKASPRASSTLLRGVPVWSGISEPSVMWK